MSPSRKGSFNLLQTLFAADEATASLLDLKYAPAALEHAACSVPLQLSRGVQMTARKALTIRSTFV